MKIKEGGVMDIRNDKDFTSLPEIAKLYQACKERDLTIAEREYLKGARDAWQAKAQADQKVKLLLCDEHLKKCESPTGIFNSQYPDEEPCLICLAKEAKAQAVPEGFALVNQKELLELTIAINAVDLATHTESKTNEVREMWQQVALKLMALGTAQEPSHD